MTRNPLLIASVVGLLYRASGLPLPMPMAITLNGLASTAGPLALLGIGAVFSQQAFRIAPEVLASALLKVAVLPMIVYAVATSLGLKDEELLTLMIFAATPTAAAAFILAKAMGADETVASSAVVLSTVLSMFSLSAVLALLG